MPSTLQSGFRLDPAFAALGRDYRVEVEPTPIEQPQLLHYNAGCAAEIGLPEDLPERAGFLALMSGAARLPDYPPIASVYAGHQFGVFVPQLGDGRAIIIAETRNDAGRRHELQLKGAGQTPFSRFADGRAVLRSSIREYLASEAMHALGIPTTRALALVGSDEPVRRETLERAAIICRVAPSHVRFGHFEFFYYHNRHDRLAPLADHVIAEGFPHLAHYPNRYAAWLSELVDRTARLLAQWQAVGFCHGVMNTDNMSALGLTLDYGPYAFMDGFDAHHICNHSDDSGRYAYDQQPMVAHWNCSRLLQATLPLLADDPEQAVEVANGILNRFPPAYTGALMDRWRAKFGFADAQHGDRELVNRFLNVLDRGHSDFTRAFRLLADVQVDGGVPALHDEVHDVEGFGAWLADYRARLRQEGISDSERAAAMRRVNPKYVLRNHLLQRAIERAERGDASEVDRLFRIAQRPYDEWPEFERDSLGPPPELAPIVVSCSS